MWTVVSLSVLLALTLQSMRREGCFLAPWPEIFGVIPEVKPAMCKGFAPLWPHPWCSTDSQSCFKISSGLTSFHRHRSRPFPKTDYTIRGTKRFPQYFLTKDFVQFQIATKDIDHISTPPFQKLAQIASDVWSDVIELARHDACKGYSFPKDCVRCTWYSNWAPGNVPQDSWQVV